MKRNKVIFSGRQKDKRALERIKESNVRLYKNGLTLIITYNKNLTYFVKNLKRELWLEKDERVVKFLWSP
jgi:hypothetical protein